MNLSKEQIETLRKAKSVIEFILDKENNKNVKKQNEKSKGFKKWMNYPSVLWIIANSEKAAMSDLNKASWAMWRHGFNWDDINAFYEMCLNNGVSKKIVEQSSKYQRKHLVVKDELDIEIEELLDFDSEEPGDLCMP